MVTLGQAVGIRMSRNIIVAGGRDVELTDAMKMELVRQIDTTIMIDLDCDPEVCPVILTGGCRGVDSDAKLFLESIGIEVRVYPADWKKYDKAAGPIRNQQMVDDADALIAFRGGDGTADMIRRAQKRGLVIRRILS